MRRREHWDRIRLGHERRNRRFTNPQDEACRTLDAGGQRVTRILADSLAVEDRAYSAPTLLRHVVDMSDHDGRAMFARELLSKFCSRGDIDVWPIDDNWEAKTHATLGAGSQRLDGTT